MENGRFYGYGEGDETSKKETGERRMKMGPNVVVPNAGQKKREKKKESQMRS